MAHKHSVYDTDTHFQIDGVTRAVKNASTTKTMVVQHDHNSERFTFEIPRNIDGHDMSTCNVVQVHYINTDAQTKAQYSGVYEVDDLQISPNGDDIVICSWLISGNATQYVGNLSFIVRFACTTDGVIDYAWNTAVHKNVFVTEGIYNGNSIALEYVDILEQWKQELIDAGVDALTLDETLLVEGEAADARATGDAIRALGEEIDYIKLNNGGTVRTINGIAPDENGNVEIAVPGGGGGGGTTFTITITNLLDDRVFTVPEGETVKLKFNYSSVDDEGIGDGPGIGQVVIGGNVRHTFSAVQGENEVDVTSYLTSGTNNVSIRVTNSENSSKQLPYVVTLAAVYLASSFDAAVPYSGEFTFPYTATGIAEKTMHFELDGVEIGTATVTTSGRQQSYTIPAQSHGSHILRAWFTCEVGGATVTSNLLYYNVICTVDGDTTPIIAVTTPPLTGVEQYSNIVKKYRVYNPASLTSAITLEVDGEVVSSLTVGRTEQTWTYRPETVGEITQTIRCGDVHVSWVQTVTESSIKVEAETEALALYLSSYGRSNNEENPGVWENNGISAEFSNFNFVSDGWVQDDDDITVMRVTGDARLSIPYKMFAYDFRTTGKTLEFEFATRDVLDYDAEVISCYNGDRGFKITAQQLLLKSEQSSLGTRYKEDEHIRVSFVVEKKTEHRLILCYINGIMSGAVQYPEDDDFSQATPVGITIGSNDCTTDIYCIRAYDNSLTKYQILDNWIADTQNIQERLDRYARNDVYDAYGQVVLSKLPTDLPYLVLRGAALPQYKGDKKTIDDSLTNPADPEQNYSSDDTQIDVQGTSSQYYRRKNYKLKYNNGFILFNGSKVAVYAMNDDAIPVATFTMKADVASSEGYYNVVSAKLFNKYHPFKIPAQEEDPRVRYSIDGFPIIIFWDNGQEVKFMGKYNFNNDKGTPEPFGLSAGDERWEVLQNGTDRVGFHSADFSAGNWKEDFEGNYPDGNTDLSNLHPMCAWVTSTDTDQATGAAIEAVTYGGVEYTADTAEYRLAKFSAELGGHFVEEAAIYYMIYTEAFLCMDQREKNVLWRYDGELGLWLPDYYDADSIIGHNNQAQPVFDYWMEDIDYTVSGDPVFNGQNSTFWKNLRATRADALKEAWHDLRKAGFSYESVMAAILEHKAKWPEAIYNEDMQVKCLDGLIEDGDGTYLPFLRGDKLAWTKWWLYNRFRYLDSKYEYGTSLENRATIRTNVMENLTLTYYIKMYGHVYYNAEHIVERVEKDAETEFVSLATGAEDRVIGINDADMLTSLGDLSGHQVELIDLSKMVKLRALKLGDGGDYVNNALNSVTFGNNILLRSVDIRNCAALTQAPDLSGCTNIEEILCEGSAISGIKLPDGGVLKTLHLPGTVVSLQIINQPKLADFTLPSYSQITTLRIENAGAADGMALDILNEMPANSRVRIIGFDREMTNSELESLLDKLDTMRGLDESGNNTDLAQVGGRVYVEEVKRDTLNRAAKYVGLTVEYGSVFLNSTRLVERTLSDYTNDRVTSVGNRGMSGFGNISVSMPNVVSTGNRAFGGTTFADVVIFPSLETVGDETFGNAYGPRVILPKATGDIVATYSGIKVFDFHSSVSFRGGAFNGVGPKAIILRNEQVCTLSGSPLAWSGTMTVGGDGRIYVPAALLDSYKTATNWSNYADQILAIEDHPEICEVE